jgi:plasmid stabilization system protein ParE
VNRVRYSRLSAKRLSEIAAFYSSKEPDLGVRAVQQIVGSLSTLAHNPYLGRPFAEDLNFRERIIPFGQGSSIALCSIERDGCIVIASIRHSKERSYGLSEED